MSEVMYAIRRVDGEDIGDYGFVTVGGPSDWSAAEDDAYCLGEAVEYELVKMTVERVAVRTLPDCSDATCEKPASHWGLCEAHAREDDPEAFEEAGVSS